MFKKRIGHTHYLFVLILATASIFRITNLDLIEFKTDEAVNLLLASRPLFGYPFPPGGTVSSIGVLNPPLFNYLLFPLTMVSLDPKWISFVIGLVNSLAIAFLFLIIKKYYNQTIAFISTTLMALSPWAILYSRKIWIQDLLIPFFVILFYCYHKLVIDRKTIFWIPYCTVSLLLIQLHQIVIIFIGILTIFLLRTVRINFKYLLIGAIIGIIPLIPYVAFEIKSSCPDCKAFVSARNKLSVERSPELFARPLQIASQGDFRFILGDDTLTFAQKFPLADSLRKIFYLEYLLIPLGAIIFIKKFKKTRFIAYSVLLLPVIYFLLKIDPFMHYYIIMMPLLFLFLAVSLNYLLLNKNLLIKFIGSVFFISIIITSLLFNHSFFSLLREKGSLNGDYGSAFYLSEKEKRERVIGLKEIPYEEAFLESFIPLNYTFGFEPLGKMLYGDVKTEEIPALEEKLIKEPENQKVKHQLLSHYTKNKPTIEMVDFFRKKATEIPQYESLYKEVYSYYLYSNFKKEYVFTPGGIRFFYPEHWEVNKLKDEIIISGDGYGLVIYQKESEVKNIFKTQELNSYQIGYFEERESRGKDRDNRIKTIEDILKSIREY